MTSDAATWGFVGVIVGGLIAGLLTLGVELIRANRAAALDSAKRRDDRQLGRDQFQRETLLDLQRAVTDFAVAIGRLHRARTSDAVADASRAALLEDQLTPPLTLPLGPFGATASRRYPRPADGLRSVDLTHWNRRADATRITVRAI